MRRGAWFVIWLVLGACLGLGWLTVGLLAIIPLALIAFALFHYFPRGRESQFGIVSGLGAVLLFVAYQNREGPGTTCWHATNPNAIGVISRCDQHLNPLPWLVVGLLLVVGGLVAELRSH